MRTSAACICGLLLLLPAVALAPSWSPGVQNPFWVAALLKPASGGSSTLNNTLTAYWTMDEPSGDALDASGAGETLTDNNTVTSGTGIISGARDFEFDNDEYFTHADDATLSLGADTDFTFNFWFKRESSTGFNQPLIAKDTTGGNTVEYIITYVDGLYFSFNIADGSGAVTVNASTFGDIANGAWHMVTCWFDTTANLVNICVDNGTVDTQAWAGGTQNGGGTFAIGKNVTGALRCDGLIDEVGFWKRALTSGERTELYNGGAAKTCCPF